VLAQVQPMTFRDIQQVDSLNLQGTRRSIYLNGSIDGLVRPDRKGGDLVLLPDGSVWLVALVLEQFPDWAKCAITLQNGT
jgi:ABC-type oligopeptide transport system substrate-binding subunit